jgi:RNA polymerase sigma-70 factor (ECF subfamily)
VIDVREAITHAHHAEWARVVASLTRRFGDLDIAEDAAAEAFATAVQRWPAYGVPPNPGAWLTTTANRKAIDRIRRENKRDDKQKEAQLLYGDDAREPLDAIDDERLRLIFTCCHPALAMETRVALTLRMVAGLTVPEIARAFLVQESTMGQRITRAKAKIKAARIPYRVPSAEDLPARVSGVLAVLFLVFNEGYLATGPDTDPVRHDLTAEAIRLTRLIRALMSEDGEVAGLLALMLLTEARRTARVSPSGELVSLAEQDRGAWDAALVAEGHRLVRERLAAGVAPGCYQILAAINAVHTSAHDMRDTDWTQVVALYDQLVRLDPSPIIALNRAVAVAELDGPEVALAAVDPLEDTLAGYPRFFAACATHDAVGCVVAPKIRIRRLACSITANTCIRAPKRVTVSKKSHASRASAWERRKSAQVLEARSGAGSIPASFRISHTVDAATCTPRTSNSPWSRRYPQQGFSFARRTTRARTELTVRGRPGRFGRDWAAWRRATMSRCQRSTVSGRTSSRSLRKTSSGS